LIPQKIKTFHFGEFFAAPQKDDRSQENESKELRTGVDFGEWIFANIIFLTKCY